MPLIVRKRKSLTNGLKLRIQVACCWTETVMMPPPAGGVVGWVDAVVAVGSVVVAVVAVGADTTAVGVAVAPPMSQAERTRESTTSKGRSKLARRLIRLTRNR